jgi:membrane associated rhomboid family serine protease
MQYNSPRGFNVLPPVVKNLLIINGLVFLFLFASAGVRTWMMQHLALHFPLSPDFNPAQIITHMFMHSFHSPFHLVFNMFGLWMFGTYVENVWGAKRFLIYYMVCGIGAAAFQLGFNYFEYLQVLPQLSQQEIDYVMQNGRDVIAQSQNYEDPALGKFNQLMWGSMVGASGAIYGILIAYGFLFPNSYVNIYFLVPIKAKYFVWIMLGISLVSGLVNSPNDNTAHFAHLGGGLVGFLWLNIDKLRRRRY